MSSLKRHMMMSIVRGGLGILTRRQVSGRENLPSGGPLLVVLNHLAHLDPLLVLSSLPWESEVIALADLWKVPVTGQVLSLYGAIPVQRDQYDREVLRRTLLALESGKVLTIAPEARQSATGALETGRTGAAYLALRSGAPILPVGITGTETAYSAWAHFTRPRLTVNFGPIFRLLGPLARGNARHEQLERGREQIMRSLAALLPEGYRGVYA